MATVSIAMKRSYNLLAEDELEENEFYQNFNKKSKKNVLQESNNLGILSPPSTPEENGKRIILENKLLTKVSKNLNTNLKTLTDDISPYTKAKNLFLRSSNPFSVNRFQLSGRETEAAMIEAQLFKSITTSASSSIYVSGPPGTGKSAQINASINKFLENAQQAEVNKQVYNLKKVDNTIVDKKIRVIKFNCMSLSNPTELFKEIYHEITGKSYNSNLGSSQLLKLFIKSKPQDCDLTILILDELDNIIHKSQQLLFELFTWTSEVFGDKNKPNLLFIGIANALNLTDRFLPRLRANCISPKLIQFLPYTAEQIKLVLTNKLISLVTDNDQENPQNNNKLVPLVHPAAIQFCAKKSAVTTGDLRRAFDIMFKAIDSFEQKLLQSKTVEELRNLPIQTLPKLMISQVVKVCSDSFNANFDMKLKPLNLQQNMILAFLFKFEEKMEVDFTQKSKLKSLKSQNITLNAFFEYYTERCKDLEHLSSLKRSEFLEVVTSLDIHGLVSLSMIGVTSTTKSMVSSNIALINYDSYKISSTVPKSEFFKHTNDIAILKRIVHSNY